METEIKFLFKFILNKQNLISVVWWKTGGDAIGLKLKYERN